MHPKKCVGEYPRNKLRADRVKSKQVLLVERIRCTVNHQRLRILVVDAHPSHRAMLVMFLVHLGHWVESVGGPGMALDRLHHDGFDVLLTSVWRSDAQGWSLLAELRKRGELPRRVITMCATPKPDAPTLSQAAGAHAHLVLPFPLAELEAALK